MPKDNDQDYARRFARAVEVARCRQRTKEQRLADRKSIGKALLNMNYPPSGIKDKTNVWWPIPWEVRECCRAIKPSIAFPWTLYKHCCTTRHVANLMNVNPNELRKVVNPRDYSQARCHECGGFEKEGACPRCVTCVECNGRRNPTKHDYLCRHCRETSEYVESP